ncbi:L,D-transpeptidase [Leptothrix cholodnii]|nr:L,D-transpeptidase [Leptothrix cholodnii]
MRALVVTLIAATVLVLGMNLKAAAQLPTRADASAHTTLQSTPPALRERIEGAIQIAERGQLDEAAALLQELAKTWPGRPEPWLNLAALASRRQDAHQARLYLEAALRTSPAHAQAYDQLQQLNADMARKAYAKALAPAAAPAEPAVLPWTSSFADESAGTVEPPVAPASDARQAPAPSPAVTASTRTAPAASGPMTPATTRRTSDPSNPSGTGTSIAWLTAAALTLLMAAAAGTVWAQRQRSRPAGPAIGGDAATRTAATLTSPEARLIDIYRLIGAARLPEALAAAEALTRDTPRFSLAQLVYGDLLLAQTGALIDMGQGANAVDPRAAHDVQALRQEASLRLQALRDLPPAGAWPKQVLQLAPSVRHLVAVDTSRSRLYVLENQPGGPRLIAHHYVSIGSQGVGKREEGDQRTPLGTYYITSKLDGKQLGDFYGAGALPLNYPNDHDRHLGRTGANIWLHGTPSAQFARAPRATNGCIVLANDDLARWLRELAPRSTPVVVADRLEWVHPKALSTDRQTALALVESWRRARVHEDVASLMALYAQHFDNGESGYDAWRAQLESEAQATHGRERQLDDISVLAWHERSDVRVITFTEVLRGSTRAITRRQYWSHESGQWKIFSEGVIE